MSREAGVLPSGPTMEPDPDATPTDTVPDPVPDGYLGRIIGGRFRLTDELGAGGIAVVYRGEDVELARAVAVKILQESGHGRAELRARFEREAKVLAALSHPNIVSLVDYGVEDGRAYLVMELLKGRTVGELLDEVDVLEPRRALHIVRQVVRALAYAHGEGLLHRDLKPDNVFLQALPDTPDHVRLLDFGFAKFVSDDRDGAPLTQAGTVFGTPRYMAPEQLTGSTVDARADLYSVAVILYEMLSGRRPFEGEVRDVLKAKVIEDPPALSAIAPDLEVHPALDAFLARALATRREERFADAQAFLEALEAIPDPWVKPKAITPAPLSKRASIPLPAIVLAVGGAGLLLVAASASIVWLAWPSDPPLAPPLPALPAPEPAIAEPEPQAVLADPWDAAGERAPAVTDVRVDVLNGIDPDADRLRALRDHARAAPDDAYAQLLLGHVFTRRGMRAMAIAAYERAAELDPGARGDPRMLVNLVTMAVRSDGGGAARAITTLYGADALPVIDAALGRENLDPREAERLAALRESVSR